MNKRLLAMLLAVVMVISMIPAVSAAEATPYLEASSLTLSGILGVNFKVNANGADMAAMSATAYIGEDEEGQALSCEIDSNGLYVYTASVPAHRLNEEIYFELYDGEDPIIEESWTLSAYLNTLSGDNAENTSLLTLIDSLQSYVDHAEAYAAGEVIENGAADGVTASDLEDSKAVVITAGMAAYAALYIDDACDLRIKVKASQFTENHTLYVDGNAVSSEELVEDGELLVYTISQILPQDWSRMHTFKIVNGEATAVEFTYSVLSYAYGQLSKEIEAAPGLHGLLKSMYLYSTAAEAYQAELAGTYVAVTNGQNFSYNETINTYRADQPDEGGYCYAIVTEESATNFSIEADMTLIKDGAGTGNGLLGFCLVQGDNNILLGLHQTNTTLYIRPNGVYNSGTQSKTYTANVHLIENEPVSVKMAYKNGVITLYYKSETVTDWTEFVSLTINEINAMSGVATSFDASAAVNFGFATNESNVEKNSLFSNVSWTINEDEAPAAYTITYELGGGTLVGEAPESYTELTAADIVLPTATMEGYDFLGWYNGDILVESLAGITEDITLTAKWKADTWYTYGDISSTGLYDFVDNEDGSVTVSANETMGTANTGRWLLSKQTGTYATATATWVHTQSSRFGGGYYLSDGTTNVLIMFHTGTGSRKVEIYNNTNTWKTSLSVDTSMLTDGIFDSIDTKMVYNNGIVTLYWKDIDAAEYTQWFAVTVADYVSAFDASEAVHVGLGFWSGEWASGQIADFSIDWTVPETEYAISYELGGGTLVGEAPESYTELTAANIVLPTATLEGYDFLGWYNGDTLIESLAGLTEDVTLTAKWTKSTWYTYGELGDTALGSVTDNEDGSVSIVANSVAASNPTINTNRWLLSKQSGTYAEATGTFVKIASRLGGGFYLSDGTINVMIIIDGNAGGGQLHVVDLDNTSGDGNNSLCTITRKASLFLGGASENTTYDLKMVYNQGYIHLFYKTATETAWSELTDAVAIAGLHSELADFDSDNSGVQIGVGFWQYKYAGGKVENFSIDWTVPETEYAISYELGGGTLVGEAPESYTELTAANIVLPTATLDGYDFIGWYNGETYVESLAGMTGDITLTAAWAADTGTYVAVTNGQNFSYNETINTYRADQPVNGGYCYVIVTEESATSFSIEADMTLIKDGAGTGNGLLGFCLVQGDNNILLGLHQTNTTLYIRPNGVYNSGTQSKTYTEAVHLIENEPVSVKMAYESGTITLYYKSETVTDWTEFVSLTIDEINAMSGVATSFDASAAVYFGFATNRSNVEKNSLFSNVAWTINEAGEVAATYSISYELGGGTLVGEAPESYTELTAADIVLPTATLDGYDFIGWYNGETYVESLAGMTGDITLTAKWAESTWYTYGELGDTALSSITDNEDGSVSIVANSVAASNPTINTNRWLLSKQSGTYAEATGTFVKISSRLGGGFYLSDGTINVMIIIDGNAGSGIIHVVDLDDTSGDGNNTLCTIERKASLFLGGATSNTTYDLKMVYDQGYIQLFYKTTTDTAWSELTDAVAIAGLHSELADFDSDNSGVQVGVGFWQYKYAGGKVENFSINWTPALETPDTET